MMTENEIAKHIVDISFRIHKKLGPGLLETVYERVLSYELRKNHFVVETQKVVPVSWDGHLMDVAFRADLLVDDLVIVELKSVEKILPVHKKQLVTYLKLADNRLGLLVNFGEALIKNGIVRLVNNLPE